LSYCRATRSSPVEIGIGIGIGIRIGIVVEILAD